MGRKKEPNSNQAISLTALIDSFQNNPSPDWSQLEAAVYDRLKQSAYRITSHSDGSVSFGATSLTHAAFIRLMTSECLAKIKNVQHFFALMTVVMRQAFADHFRKRNTWKNGGRMNEIPLELAIHGLEVSCNASYFAIDECMDTLSEMYPRQAKVLTMQVILGMEVNEIATALDISKSTIESDLRFAKAFLRRQLEAV